MAEAATPATPLPETEGYNMNDATLRADRQATVDALYLLLATRGYVPQDLIRDQLAAVASDSVKAALRSLQHAEDEIERKRALSA
jgi:hypothetical protein